VAKFVMTALAAILWSLPAGAQTVSGSIQGQIVDGKTGAPVRFANVMLRGPFSQPVLAPPMAPAAPATIVEITADEQGRFVFPSLAVGYYAVNARHDGYKPTLYGATHTARALVPVKDGEQTSDIAIAMPPCGVIAGRVTNENGQPVQNVELVVLRYYYGAWLWRPPVTPETPLKTYTNDLGEFRISNLIEGQYIVRAAAPPQTGKNKLAGMGYPSIFYPSAVSPEAANPIAVASGEVSKADITLQSGPAFHIAGLIDSNGSSEEVCFGLAPKRYNSAVAQVIGRVIRFGKDGQFLIDDVPPGSYVLSAALCHGIPPLGAMQPLEVAGNLDGLRIQLNSGQRLSGVIKSEGVNPSGVKLLLRSPDLLSGYVSRAEVGADGGFVFETVMPRHHIVDFVGLPPGAYVKSVKYGGREVPESGFEIEGEASLEITLSSLGAAQFSGAVLDRTGQPAPYAMVMVLPSDGGPMESAKDVMADEKGNFVFPALRPGTYKALAWEVRYNPFGLESADPILPTLFEANARIVTLSAAAPQSVGLTLNTIEDVSQARAVDRTPPKTP
jgi:hypothetical protein